jgi:hypothetical protein
MLNVAFDFSFEGSTSELLATRVLISETKTALTCVRGTYVPKDASGTFPWTAGVRACALAVLKYYLFKESRIAGLSGGAGSAAAVLDSALLKVPIWLTDMFGNDSQGAPCARRLFRRLNPERRRPGPVQIIVNENYLAPSNLKVLVNGQMCGSEDVLRALIKHVASYWPDFDPLQGSIPARVFEPDVMAVDSAASHPLAAVPAQYQAADVSENPYVIAESDLVVIKSITVAWKLEEILTRLGLSCSRVIWDWSDDLLIGIEEGRVNIAIYNTARTHRFIKEKQASNIVILTDCGYSMGGRNFYVLARRDSPWGAVSGLEAFVRKLRNGAVIAIPENSDMLDNLFEVIKCSPEQLREMGVQVIRIPISQGLEALDLNPNALLVHGQNVRFQARYRGLYHEVLNYDMLPAAVQAILRKNAGNSLIIDRRLVDKLGLALFQASAEEAKKEFYNAWLDKQRYPALLKEVLAEGGKYGTSNDGEMTYVIEHILYETYRLGRPGV